MAKNKNKNEKKLFQRKSKVKYKVRAKMCKKKS